MGLVGFWRVRGEMLMLGFAGRGDMRCLYITPQFQFLIHGSGETRDQIHTWSGDRSCRVLG
jgi:hypothetical protein